MVMKGVTKMKHGMKKKYDTGEKWVECLNCSQEYVIEAVVDGKGCPVCGSYAFEESTSEHEDWGK